MQVSGAIFGEKKDHPWRSVKVQGGYWRSPGGMRRAWGRIRRTPPGFGVIQIGKFRLNAGIELCSGALRIPPV